MKIAVAFENGQVCQDLTACEQYLTLTVDGDTPVGKDLISCQGGSTTAMLTMVGQYDIQVLICGKIGIATRNALEMLGVMIIPGVTGSAEEAVAKFLVGEMQGDPTVLGLCREEDPNDPMNCMHDCSRCAGCGPIKVEIPKE